MSQNRGWSDSRERALGAVQQSLFGEEDLGPKPYVTPTRIVRNTLKNLLDEMRASETWPWSPSMVEIHRNRNFAYLCGLLPDAAEAARWRAEIEAEAARLDAVAMAG
jgi:hypothetical protein